MKIGYLVFINYRVTIKERATRYRYAKTSHVIILHNRPELHNPNFNTPLRIYPLIDKT